MHVQSVTVTVTVSNGDAIAMTYADPQPASDDTTMLREQAQYGGMSALDRVCGAIQAAYGRQVNLGQQSAAQHREGES